MVEAKNCLFIYKAEFIFEKNLYLKFMKEMFTNNEYFYQIFAHFALNEYQIQNQTPSTSFEIDHEPF